MKWMSENVTRIRKRDGRRVAFEPVKIKNAIEKAPAAEPDTGPFLTVDSEYSGGCRICNPAGF
jgi:hypothetical protein